jgi:AraC-like DNA-binding protein
MGQLTYVVPHIHRELELAMVLDGEIHLVSGGESQCVHPGECWLMNACQCHELYSTADTRQSLFLELQISTSFFKHYYRDIETIRFDKTVLRRTESEPMIRMLLPAAEAFFAARPYFELRCAGIINQLFAGMLETVPNTRMSEEELRQNDQRMNRMQRMTDYIEEHLGEKLLLTDLAEQESLTLNYISHFFKASFGMPFQTYLQHIRCRRAAALLLETDETPTEISIQCGFSALKYMNQGFENLFGCKPGDYRTRGEGKRAEQRGQEPISLDATLSPHLSSKDALRRLRTYMPSYMG